MTLELRPFELAFAANVCSWVQSNRDLLWLAPRTEPPISDAKVLAWHHDRCTPMLLFELGDDEPCGYADINRMKVQIDNVWLGHIIIAPSRRRRGYGAQFVRLLLEAAFADSNTTMVSLVVFPDNVAAIRCYQNCGFRLTCNEYHRFRDPHARQRMLRLDLRRTRWEKSASAAQPVRDASAISAASDNPHEPHSAS